MWTCNKNLLVVFLITSLLNSYKKKPSNFIVYGKWCFLQFSRERNFCPPMLQVPYLTFSSLPICGCPLPHGQGMPYPLPCLDVGCPPPPGQILYILLVSFCGFTGVSSSETVLFLPATQLSIDLLLGFCEWEGNSKDIHEADLQLPIPQSQDEIEMVRAPPLPPPLLLVIIAFLHAISTQSQQIAFISIDGYCLLGSILFQAFPQGRTTQPFDSVYMTCPVPNVQFFCDLGHSLFFFSVDVNLFRLQAVLTHQYFIG